MREVRKIEGYYTKETEAGTGRLRIEVMNLPEFKKLIKQAKKEADQLRETINRLENFELAIDFKTLDE